MNGSASYLQAAGSSAQPFSPAGRCSATFQPPSRVSCPSSRIPLTHPLHTTKTSRILFLRFLPTSFYSFLIYSYSYKASPISHPTTLLHAIQPLPHQPFFLFLLLLLLDRIRSILHFDVLHPLLASCVRIRILIPEHPVFELV